MLVLSSPSGAGKSTISRALLEREPELTMSVSATTRPPRPGEEDGKDYYFLDKDKFHTMVENDEFLEHATVFDNSYGTPRGPVEASLSSGRDVLFDVDWQGTQQLHGRARNDLVRIFILPPSQEELERRLRTRAQDPEDVIKKRMSKAADEMKHYEEYDYIVVNVDVEESVSQVQAILTAERLKKDRREGLYDFVRELCGKGMDT
ncbi:guanylate kinase [Magnetovibrio sp. PR-2]|uniref:guanylate kinase n=1 Tax=Magnetovibrio sp. PR-2 TaxID=3120356 RepID=UPI002FCE606F